MAGWLIWPMEGWLGPLDRVGREAGMETGSGVEVLRVLGMAMLMLRVEASVERLAR